MHINAKWVLIATLSLNTFAQTPPAPLSFEAASIKPAPAPTGPGISVNMNTSKERLNYNNVSLRDLIANTYNLKDFQLTGPDWIKTQRFDIVATNAPDATWEQVRVMLQTLLAERFKLLLHRDRKELPAYALVVGKNGPKLKDSPPVEEDLPAAPGADPGTGRRKRGSHMSTRGGKLTAERVGMTQLADYLARQLDRPVVDQTNLKGAYDLTLEFTPEQHEGGRPPSPESAGLVADAAPPIFSAIQQELGLKLNPHKLAVEILIVDTVEKTPTEN